MKKPFGGFRSNRYASGSRTGQFICNLLTQLMLVLNMITKLKVQIAHLFNFWDICEERGSLFGRLLKSQSDCRTIQVGHSRSDLRIHY